MGIAEEYPVIRSSATFLPIADSFVSTSYTACLQSPRRKFGNNNREIILIRFSKSVALATLFSISVCAQAADQTTAPRQTFAASIATKPGMHLLISAGLTFGGDTIATAKYTDGSSKNVNAGGLVQFGLGGSYQFEEAPVNLALTANYHYHTAAASNGDITFSRVPVEILAYYTGVERWRFGGGVRFVNSAQATAKVNGNTEKMTFDNTRGYVAEFGYKAAKSSWVNFRYVSEKYTGNTDTSTSGVTTSAASNHYDGSHFGVNFVFEF